MLESFLLHEHDQVGEAARVAPFVVVPRNDLGEASVLHRRVFGFDDGRVRVALEVRRHEWLFAEGENTAKPALRGFLEVGAQSFGRGVFFENGCEVHYRDCGGGHAQRVACELALEFRDDLGNGLCCARRCRDDVQSCRACASQVLVGKVEDALVVGVGMDSGHGTGGDAVLLLDDEGHGREAVGGARGVGHHMVLLRVIGVVVDAHDDGDVLLLGGGGDDDLLRPVLDMDMRLFRRPEDARRFDDHVNADITPNQLRRVSLCEAGDLPVAHARHIAVHLRCEGGASVVGVVLKQVEVRGGVEQVVDGHHLGLVAIAFVNGAKDLTAYASETVDANSCLAHGAPPPGIILRRCGRCTC